MMGNTLNYRITCPVGSLDVKGIGLRYIYSAPDNFLHICIDHKSCKPIFSIYCDRHLSKEILEFIFSIEKISKIKAIILSNHTSVDLTDTMMPQRLDGILDSICYIAQLNLYLEQKRYKKFSKELSYKYNLKDFNIKQFCCQQSGTSYYRALIQSGGGQEAVIRDVEISGLIRKLSESVIRDLIAREFGQNNDLANSLLMLSSDMSIMARLMDKHFIPENNLNRDFNHKEKINN